MTYDVQRWDSPDYDLELDPLDDGLWVLAADAEAHEKAAVKAAIVECAIALAGAARRREREQAIRGCIAAVPHEAFCSDARLAVEPDWHGCICQSADAEDSLRALLEGEGY